MLYKYRSLENLEWIADIIEKKRLYTSKYTELNDSMEGMFWYRDLPDDVLAKNKIEKEEFKICSLSKKWDCPLMWAHYANAFKGIVIGVNKKSLNQEYKDNVIQMRYDGPIDVKDDRITAKEILSHKTKEWRYEKEVRVLTKNDFINVEIEQIVLGSRISANDRLEMIRLVEKANLTDKIIEYKDALHTQWAKTTMKKLKLK